MPLQVSCLHMLALEASALQLPDPTTDAKKAAKRVSCCIQWPAGTCKTCIDILCCAYLALGIFTPQNMFCVEVMAMNGSLMMLQFWRGSGIEPEELPVLNTYHRTDPEGQRPAKGAKHSSQTGLAGSWRRNVGLPLLEVPILVSRVQEQPNAGYSIVPEALPKHQMSSSTLLPIPEEAVGSSLAELWDADSITQQLLAVKLIQQAQQLSLPHQHETWQLELSMAAWSAQQGLFLLPKVIMTPRLSSRYVIEQLLSSCLSSAYSLPKNNDLAVITAGLSFHDVVAPGQVLCDSHPTLPLVLIEDKASMTATALHGPMRIAQSIQAKPLSLAAIEILLDWSLKNPAAPDPSKRLKKVRHASLAPTSSPQMRACSSLCRPTRAPVAHTIAA